MARYPEEHKAATRRRILDTAARRLKADGVDGSGVSTLMADAGLTNGAFYAHFPSKDALVATVVSDQLAAQRDAAAALDGPDAVARLVRQYLSPQHRDHRSDGCASAALLDEIARAGDEIRSAYDEGACAWADAVVGQLHRRRSPAARATVLAALAGMVGTLQMARAVTDPALSDALLERGAAHALAALGLAA
ncbi:TetR/AcrR family transcriptional regulator [Jatrophihabitans sp. YIM 134969]